MAPIGYKDGSSPLISKFLNKQLARKLLNQLSLKVSVEERDVQIKCFLDYVRLTWVGYSISYLSRFLPGYQIYSSQAIGAGPRTLVDIGSIAVLPT